MTSRGTRPCDDWCRMNCRARCDGGTRGARLRCSRAVAAAVLQLYMVMHLELKLQLEAFLRVVLLPLAEGRGEPPKESQRVALECIVDLCRQPAFVPDLYVNFDCDVERPNLFEELVRCSAEARAPQDGAAFDATHLLSLEGLLAITAGIADRSAAVPPAGTASAHAEANDDGRSWAARFGVDAPPGARAKRLPGGVARARALRRNRRIKRRLLMCADHFNRIAQEGTGVHAGDQAPAGSARGGGCGEVSQAHAAEARRWWASTSAITRISTSRC